MLLRRRLSLIAIGALVVGGMLSGCAPSPAPTPTPTPAFASDEEAFAAAEEVYRAYIAAGNEERGGDPDANPERHLIGDALEAEIQIIQDLHANQLHVDGEAVVSSFRGREADIDIGRTLIQADACLDVTNTRVLDSLGTDVTPPDRQQTLPLSVTFIKSDSTLLISDSTLVSEEPC
ncbi:hypothetical protein [Microbacterium maritypicum]